MTDEPSSSLDRDVPDEDVRGMVAHIEPDWAVQHIERSPHGTDFVATLAVETPGGDRTVVLKATTADLVPPEVARAEPRLLDLVDRETSIPVPTVFGYCDKHDEYPAPFYLLSHVEGSNFEGDGAELTPRVRENVVRQAGHHLAELHALGTLSGVGRVGVRDGELAVLEGDGFTRYDDFREYLRDDLTETLDSLEDGGFFPEMADDRERFADLVPDLRGYVAETVPALPDPDPPTYSHNDYRYGNLLVDPETGEVRAVLDWANLLAGDPAYNLAITESLLLTPDRDEPTRTDELRQLFRIAYVEARGDWAFDSAVRERMRFYRLVARLKAMACLPLWYADATPEERDEREAEHRAFLEAYL